MGTENISLIFSALLFECQNVGRSAGGGGGGGGGEKDKEKEKSSHSWFKLGSKSSKQEKEEKKSGIHGDRASYLATGSSNNQLGPASTEMVADSFKNDLVQLFILSANRIQPLPLTPHDQLYTIGIE